MHDRLETILARISANDPRDTQVPWSVADLVWARSLPPAVDEPSDESVASPFAATFNWFAAEDSEGRLIVLVGCSDACCLIAVPEIRWIGPTEPGVFAGWTRIVGRNVSESEVWRWIAETARRRRTSFRRCKVCGELVAPEHREGFECHACMEAQGVNF